MDQFSQTGFRWDFLIYSASAVYIGWFFIFKKKITDPLYIHIFGVYCITNAFWILVITAAFSNRFAYLSWFLMPVVFAYPMFRYKIWDNQYKTFSVILLLYFMFTFFCNNAMWYLPEKVFFRWCLRSMEPRNATFISIYIYILFFYYVRMI